MAEQDFSPETMIMEANIREFAYSISMICALETGGKLTAEEAYAAIKVNWKKLDASRKNLFGDGKSSTSKP